MNKIKKIVSLILFSILLITPNAALALDIGGVDLLAPKESVLGYGVNIWHTNYSRGTAKFPLGKAWEPVSVGKVYGQPVLIDNYIFVQTESQVVCVDKESGTRLGAVAVESNSAFSTPFVLKNTEGSYQIIVSEKTGIRNINATISGTSVQYKNKWIHEFTTVNTVVNTVNILEDNNKSIDKKYVAYTTANGFLVVLYADNGKVISNGSIDLGGSVEGISPLTFYSYNDQLSKLLVPVIKDDEDGYVAGATVINGVLQYDLILNRSMQFNIPVGKLTGPNTLTYVTDLRNGEARPVMLMQEDKGIILGYDPDSNEVLFRITKFEGDKINGITVKGNYVIVSYKEGYILSFDIMRAIENAQDNEEYGMLANDIIVFYEALNGQSNSGTAAFSVVDVDTDDYGNIRYTTQREVLVTADLSNKNGTNNLYMYYLDKYDSKNGKPLAVPYAFMDNGLSLPGLFVPGGVTSRLSFAGGYLAYVDGNGYLHGLTAQKNNNLSLCNFDNTSNILEKGKTYTAAVDLVNFTGEKQTNVPFKFVLYDDQENIVHTHAERITFGSDGCTVYIKYTIPAGFNSKNLTIQALVNMDEERNPQESTYEDNIASITMDMRDDIDIQIVALDYAKYPANQRVNAIVKIKNSADVSLADPPVPVKFTITWNGQVSTKTKEVIIPESSKGIVSVPFSFTTPDANTTFVMTAEVNSYNLYNEVNLNNNKKSITVTVTKNSYTTHSGEDVNAWGNNVQVDTQIITHKSYRRVKKN